jgi:polar amino acid transport system substrate-binding protein
MSNLKLPSNMLSDKLSAVSRSAGLTLQLALLAVGFVVPFQPAQARPLDEVIASKSLRVIAYQDNAPFSWDDNGTPTGIDVDLAKAIARELGVGPEIVLRMPGEKSDDDLRVNIWKGPLTGGGVGDIMMHVPIDREFARRNKEAVLGNPYFQEQVAVAIHPELTGENPTFEVFKKTGKKITVQLATAADYFLLSYQDGVLIDNVTHHIRAEDGAKEFADKKVAALMGVRAKIEALLFNLGLKPTIVKPVMDGIVRRDWVIGMAWKEDSRDLGHATQSALEKIKAGGELQKIFENYGVTYVEPPMNDRYEGPLREPVNEMPRIRD